MASYFFAPGRRRSILYRRIVLYFCSLIVVLLCVCAFLFMLFLDEKNRDAGARIEDNMQAIASQIEDAGEQIFGLFTMLLDEQALELNMKPYAQYTTEELLGCKEFVRLTHRYNAFMPEFTGDLFIYIDDARVYTKEGMVYSEFFFESLNRYDMYDKKWWMEWLRGPSRTAVAGLCGLSNMSMQTQKSVIPVLCTNYVGSHIAVAATNVHTDRLLSAFKKNAVFAQTVFFLQTEDGAVYPSDARAASLYTDRSAKDYITASVQIPWLGVTVSSMTSKQTINARESALFLRILLFDAAMLAVAMALATAFSLKIYKPIRSLHQNIGDHVPQEENQTINELRSIESSVQHLIDSKRDFADYRMEYEERYLHQGIVRYLESPAYSSDAYLERLMQQRLGEGPYRLYAALGPNEQRLYDLQQAHGGLLVVPYRPGAAVVISPDGADDFTRDDAARIAGCFDACSTGMLVSRFAELSVGFESACAQLWAAIQPGTGQGVSLQPEKACLSGIEETTIAMAAKNGNDARILEIIRGKLQHLPEASCSFEEITAVVHSLCRPAQKIARQLARISPQKGALVNEADPFSVLFLRSDMGIAQTIQSLYERLTSGLLQHVERSTPESLSAKARQCIEENYTDALSLVIIADALGVSPKYLSHVFKEETGINLSDYISFFRVQKAKELLGAGYSVQRTGELVGIGNALTFTRTFRRVENMTPSEFCQLIRERG